MTRRQQERQHRLEEIKEVCYDFAGAILLGIKPADGCFCLTQHTTL